MLQAFGADIVSVIGSIRPIADAGHNQRVELNTTVQLDGSRSSDHPNSTLTYQWTQTQGPEVTLSDPTAKNPTFTAPDVLLQKNLVFELVVTNEQGLVSEPDSVTITIVS